MHYGGDEVNDIFDTLTITEAGEDESLGDKAIDALSAYFQPKQNVAYEEYQFRQAKQDTSETIMAYYTRLKHLAQTCEFTNVDREIKSQIIQHCIWTKLRRKALSDSNISLSDLLHFGKTMEITDSQAAALENEDKRGVNSVGGRWHSRDKGDSISNGRDKRNGTQRRQDHVKSRGNSESKCRNCNGQYPHQGGKTSCPAYGKECRKCGKKNHFQAVCRSESSSKASKGWNSGRKRITLGTLSDSDTEDENVFRIRVHKDNNSSKRPFFKVRINGTLVTVMADSGSSINILDEGDFEKLKQPRPELRATSTRVYPYESETPIQICVGSLKRRLKPRLAWNPKKLSMSQTELGDHCLVGGLPRTST